MRRSRQTGMAMVIVIWVLTLLAIMAGSFALTMRRETTVISAVRDNAIMLAAAETGITIAQQMLLLADENKRWRADGSVYQVQYKDAEIRLRLLSEQGKIDINKADEDMLTKLISSTTVEMDKQQELVSAIIDWRDKDDLVRLNGAEKQQYEDAGLTYQPANTNFQLIDELQMVLGMNATIFQELQPLITVYSSQSNVNLSVASKEVLQATLDIDPVILDQYIQQRTENNQNQLPPPELPPMDNTGGKQNVSRSGVYTVISQARRDEEVGGGIKIIIKKTGNKQRAPFQVLSWQRRYQELSLFSAEVEQLLVTGYDESEREN